MKFDVKTCRIISKQKIATDTYDFTLFAGELAQIAQPGQFVHIQVPGKTLRRPISICHVNKENNTLRIVFQIRGEGTEILSQLKTDDTMNLLAPLGHGYEIGDTKKKVLLVGGGIGVPPLLYLAKQYGENATVVIGFRSKEFVILEQDFIKAGCNVIVVTDDGTYGHHGLVTDCIADVVFDEMFACGPMPMLKALAHVADERHVPFQVSLEERMACGVGACLGCACKTKREEKQDETYSHVCKDGPVFDYKKIVF